MTHLNLDFTLKTNSNCWFWGKVRYGDVCVLLLSKINDFIYMHIAMYTYIKICIFIHTYINTYIHKNVSPPLKLYTISRTP